MKTIAFRLALAIGLLCVTMSSRADERILSYDSSISISRDGSMDVIETIRVRSEGIEINHGIYRDFPTDYKDARGHRYRVAFDFIEARRGGNVEPWHAEAQSNGVRIYLGSADVSLDAGEYLYTLHYRTNRQLGFFEDHDELFWNVTGNGWAFPIDTASATLELPQAVDAAQIKASGYTGPQGSRDVFLSATPFVGGARYATTQPLQASEGLSVVLEFPKGVVIAPSTSQKIRWLLQDNLYLVVGFGGLILLWLWYAWRWNKIGRDPEGGIRIALYEPPAGYSAAALRYVREMGYDDTCFAAAILSLAAKGALRISQDDDDIVTLEKLAVADRSRLAAGDSKVFDELFKSSGSLRLVSSTSMAATMNAAKSAHRQALALDYEKKYFVTNRKTVVAGLVASLGIQLAAALSARGEAMAITLFLCLWLSIWSIPVYALCSATWTNFSGKGVGKKLGGVMMGLFALPFVAVEIGAFGMMAYAAGVGMLAILLALIGTNVAFYHWMKAPTIEGARLLNQIEGFRWYLGVAEKQELDSRYQPESRPELFAEYLPYALALDIEQAWAKRFADALPPDQFVQAQPPWYTGAALMAGNSSALTSGFSDSLVRSISSASTAPGSSSGSSSSSSSGGSGGGGGGGGGGGW